MRVFLSIFIAAAVSTVSGSFFLSSRQTAYPACAQTCLESANFGSCGPTDVTCLCQETSFIVSTTQCFEANCSSSDLATADSVAQQACAAAGVTLTSSVPPASSTPSGSSTSSGASKASSPSSSSSTPSASAKPNGALSNAVNIIGGAAALGLAGLML
ncbi:hypothetical protein EI94DRAFT_1696531 [Lactarius quietus]|nr:hypothetical protein EI94DRAFT_1696531 [Lactarius quietus]